LLNRNPSDNHRPAVEQAQDERGRRLLQEARGLRGLTPDQVGRIASRLEAAVAPERRRRLVPVAATLVVLLSAGTALAWATGTLQRLPVVRALFSLRAPASRAPRPSAGAGPALPSTGVAAPIEPPTVASPDDLEAIEPSGGADMTASPARRRGGLAHPAAGPHERRDQMAPVAAPISAAAPRTSASAAPDSLIVREGESFAAVLRRWRRDHDGQAALAALDLHDRGFVGGQMALESRLLRVEILLFERRDHDALAILDVLPLGKVNLPRGRELLTVRGELRVKAGRCDDGRADLLAVLGGSGILAQRARNALTYCP
jgi:hypothetical protein